MDVLELGAGTGLVSTVLSSLCHKIIASDRDASILDLTTENFSLNSHITHPQCTVQYLNLDWTDFSANQIRAASDVDVIVACDVAYDFDLSEAFFSCLMQICLEQKLKVRRIESTTLEES